MGKPDDCYELETLRSFRDNYMAADEFKADVEEYYEIAPKIVSAIENTGSQSTAYDYIYSVITDCVTCIEKEDYVTAYELYKKMSLELQNQYL